MRHGRCPLWNRCCIDWDLGLFLWIWSVSLISCPVLFNRPFGNGGSFFLFPLLSPEYPFAEFGSFLFPSSLQN